MTNRVWLQGSPLRFRVSPPGVDVLTSDAIDNLIDERLGTVTSISGSASVVRSNGTLADYPHSTTVLFGRTFPSPPAFVFTAQDLFHTGYNYGLRPIFASGQAAWNIEAKVYVDRVIFDSYSSPSFLNLDTEDLVYWRAFI